VNIICASKKRLILVEKKQCVVKEIKGNEWWE
jgi:hypothetical protein